MLLIHSSRFMKNFFTLLFVFVIGSAHAATYYFSSVSGDDSRTSSQAERATTPWKTLDKLNSFFHKLRPGDFVLFKRGETFYGPITIKKSGVKGSPIVIGAYGTGSRPVITGLTKLSHWVAVGNGVYESYNSSLRTNLNMLLLDDVQQPMGRYPNTGYLTHESHAGKKSITDNELSSAPNWKDAELVMRTVHWVIERCKITSHSGNTIFYRANKGAYQPGAYYGYFIQNSVKTLDEAGEWYYNHGTKKVSMYFGTKSPSSFNVTASAVDYLIYSRGKSYVVFDNLTLKGANKKGFDISGGSNFSIKNCDVLFSGETGIRASNAYLKVENCKVLNSNTSGIVVESSMYAAIRNNMVKNTYTIAGMAKSGQGQGSGIRIGKNGLAEYNHIINSGFIGISFSGDYAVVKNNYIDTFCFLKDDGGAIYASNGNNLTFRGRKVTGNIVLNGIGAAEGTNITSSNADGIYMDDDVNGVEITGNTIANANRGLYLHNTRNIVVRNNTSFNNNSGQLHMKHDGLGEPLRNHTIINNIFFSKLARQIASSIYTKADDIGSIGRLDSNYYARPIDDRMVISNIIHLYSSTEDKDYLDLAGWKAEYNKDPASKRSAKQIAPYKVKSVTGANKLAYGAFNSSTDARKPWANKCSLSWHSGVLDGGNVKVVPSAKSSSIVLYVSALDAAKKYILRYSLKGTGVMSIGAYLRSSDYKALTSTQYRTVSTTRSENEMLFTPSADETSGALVFSVDARSTYHLDNIQLYEADVAVTNPDDSIRFIFNASQVSKTISLDGSYVDVKNDKFSNSITLQPYQSAVLIKDDGVQNTASSVNITSPKNSSAFAGPASVTISADAANADGTISKVEFYNGSRLLHTEYNSPYLYTWNNVPAGTYTLTAKAADDKGAVTTSAAVVISVSADNAAPAIRITSPGNGSTFAARATINMIAVASDADGTISRVQFYNGTKLLHTEYQGIYSYSWSNVQAGTYTITAKVTDDKGAVTASAPVTISVAKHGKSRRSLNNNASNVANNANADSIKEVTALSPLNLKLFPNPAGNTVFVSGNGLPQNKEFIISVVSINGIVLKTIHANTSDKAVEVNISSLGSGVYIIKAAAGSITINKQFVKL